jgi:hypothetical protein
MLNSLENLDWNEEFTTLVYIAPNIAQRAFCICGFTASFRIRIILFSEKFNNEATASDSAGVLFLG